MPDHKTFYFKPRHLRLDFDPQGDALRPWKVVGNHWFINDRYELLVPAGFRTDLASVPLWLLWFISPWGNHQRAAVFHDVAYREQKTSRIKADAEFYEMMTRDGVPSFKAYLMYLAVRMCGWAAWEDNRQANAQARATGEARCSDES